MTQHVVRWWGPSPWGPAMEPDDDDSRSERIPTPVGERCLDCEEEIQEGDYGLMAFLYGTRPREVAHHRECLMLKTIGPCPRPGMNFRQAALAAARSPRGLGPEFDPAAL